MPLLHVQNLHVSFGPVRAVTGVSLRLEAGETLGLLGESGCGKSATAMAIPRLLPSPPADIRADAILLRGRDITSATARELQALRGRDVGVVFQDPMTSLSPLLKIAPQIVEALRLHRPLSAKAAHGLALEWLAKVGIDRPHEIARSHPYQLSGGMQQRVMIAIALANDPPLLIADEPTTALDVTLQARILELMTTLRAPGTGLLLITHDIGVVYKMATRIAVMYAGQIVEEAPAALFFKRPLHPYARALLEAVPSLATHGKELPAIPGQVPSPTQWPPGCRFAARCRHAMPQCVAMPRLCHAPDAPGRTVRCWLYGGAA